MWYWCENHNSSCKELSRPRKSMCYAQDAILSVKVNDKSIVCLFHKTLQLLSIVKSDSLHFVWHNFKRTLYLISLVFLSRAHKGSPWLVIYSPATHQSPAASSIQNEVTRRLSREERWPPSFAIYRSSGWLVTGGANGFAAGCHQPPVEKQTCLVFYWRPWLTEKNRDN